MVDLSKIDPHLDPVTGMCRVIVETPKGSRAKYTYDPDIEAYELSGQLPAGLSFPLDFGFVPRTRGDDGDPLDILVIGDEPSAVGVAARVKILGIIEAEQTERDGTVVRNDRLLARLEVSVQYRHADHIEDLGERFVEHLGRFFVNFNALKGKDFRVLGVAGPEAALDAIQAAIIEGGGQG